MCKRRIYMDNLLFEKEHIDNNTAVRDMLLQRGIKPEQLSPNEDIKKVQRRINKDNKKNLKNK